MSALSVLAEAMALPRHEAIPVVLPAGWNHIQRFGDGDAWQYRNGIRVIVSTGDFDGRDWMHISMSRADRMPTYDDMKFVKNTFAPLGYGYQVFPPPEENINIHDFCLHVWVPCDGKPALPNFGRDGTI